jgi:hypothetical protein
MSSITEAKCKVAHEHDYAPYHEDAWESEGNLQLHAFVTSALGSFINVARFISGENLLVLPGIETRLPGRPARKLANA